MSKAQDPQLSQIIDNNFQQLFKDLEAYYHANEERISQEQKDFYSPQISQLEAQLHESEQLYDNMESKATTFHHDIIQKEAVVQRMVHLSSQLHSKIRNGNTCSRFFQSWVSDGTDKDVLLRSFEAIFLHRAQQRIFFRRWSRKTIVKRDARLTREIRTRYDKEMKSKSTDFNRQISQLESQVAAARALLEEKQRNFIEMQQRLKKAFMRGVVNINLEAMDVFNGAQLMGMMQEIEGGEQGQHDVDAPVDESDDDFYVEDAPEVKIVRHQ